MDLHMTRKPCSAQGCLVDSNYCLGDRGDDGRDGTTATTTKGWCADKASLWSGLDGLDEHGLPSAKTNAEIPAGVQVMLDCDATARKLVIFGTLTFDDLADHTITATYIHGNTNFLNFLFY